jgi:hypothetical protein
VKQFFPHVELIKLSNGFDAKNYVKQKRREKYFDECFGFSFMFHVEKVFLSIGHEMELKCFGTLDSRHKAVRCCPKSSNLYQNYFPKFIAPCFGGQLTRSIIVVAITLETLNLQF